VITLSIFKGKGALEFTPSLPKEDEKYPKPGGVFIKFANAVEPKKYDWANSQSIMLNANEITTFINMIKTGEGSIYHDPDKGKPAEGTRNKILGVYNGTSSLLLNLTMGTLKYGCSLSKADIDMLETMLKSVLPRLYRWV
jgi:hypothetical protein